FGLIIATIIVLVVSTGMGIVLLKGSYNKNPCQLKAWLIYQSILVVLDERNNSIDRIVRSSDAGLMN
ncbi:unnamed protein product, partial [Allacma fusca]